MIMSKFDDDHLGVGRGGGDISIEMSVGSVAAGGVPVIEWCCYHLLCRGGSFQLVTKMKWQNNY